MQPVQSEHYPKGSGSVILLRPQMGLALPKHNVISMHPQQYTDTKHIPIERYHPVDSIMLKYMTQIKTFGKNLCYREMKFYKIFGVTDRTFLSNATNFRNDCNNKRSVQMKHFSKLRKN